MNKAPGKMICAAVETPEQLKAAVSHPYVDICCFDACYTDPSDYRMLCDSITERGKTPGIRFPQVWRKEAETYFEKYRDQLLNAGFRRYIVRSMEGLLWLRDRVLPWTSGAELVIDHTIYSMNNMTDHILMKAADSYVRTLSLELSMKELAGLVRGDGVKLRNELVVYGRAPVMISRQCVNNNTLGCDRKEKLLFLRDRKSAVFPVKNCCRFCFNTVYNSVPTVIYDLTEDIGTLSPDVLRYEFTTESAADAEKVLDGIMPGAGTFTRGHFRRPVE